MIDFAAYSMNCLLPDSHAEQNGHNGIRFLIDNGQPSPLAVVRLIASRPKKPCLLQGDGIWVGSSSTKQLQGAHFVWTLHMLSHRQQHPHNTSIKSPDELADRSLLIWDTHVIRVIPVV